MAAGVAALAVAGAASAQALTSPRYVDGLRWRIDHAAQTGAIDAVQRTRLLSVQSRTVPMAWRCNSGEQYACSRVADNVNYINASLRMHAGGYGMARGAATGSLTSMGYVSGLRWQVNHAAETGMINLGQRDRLLAMQMRTRNLAWRCDRYGDQNACTQAISNVEYINRSIGRPSVAYGYGQ